MKSGHVVVVDRREGFFMEAAVEELRGWRACGRAVFPQGSQQIFPTFTTASRLDGSSRLQWKVVDSDILTHPHAPLYALQSSLLEHQCLTQVLAPVRGIHAGRDGHVLPPDHLWWRECSIRGSSGGGCDVGRVVVRM